MHGWYTCMAHHFGLIPGRNAHTDHIHSPRDITGMHMACMACHPTLRQRSPPCGLGHECFGLEAATPGNVVSTGATVTQVIGRLLAQQQDVLEECNCCLACSTSGPAAHPGLPVSSGS
jgi:hypothetical protein